MPELAHAIALHRVGKVQEAERLYEQIVAAEPGNAQAWHLLGLVAYQRGAVARAIELIERAIGLSPAEADIQANLGLVLHAAGRHTEAIAALGRALELKPDHLDALYNLGNALQAAHRLADAAGAYQRALTLAPDFVEAHNNLGNVLRDLGRLDEAEASYRRALALRPDIAVLHNNLGNLLKRRRALREAVACYREALRLKPDFAEALNNLGNALQEEGKTGEALDCYRQALAKRPDFAAAHNNLGNALHELNRIDEAAAALERAVALDPRFAKAWLNLSLARQDQGRAAEAVAALERAVALDPDYADARVRLLNAHLQLCDWRSLDAELAAVRRLIAGPRAADIDPYFLIFLPGISGRDQRRVAEAYAAQRFAGFAARRVAHAQPAKKDRLRIGYLSADFHAHATAFLLAEVIELHDRARFEIVGYSLGPDDGSAMRRRLTAAFDRFHDLRGLPIDGAAARIRGDGIDILIDLKGYTGQARPEIMALRPAPVQASFLGYPGTMGADFIDYLITDPIVSPPDQADAYSEALAYLPDCYQPNDRSRVIAAHRPSRGECGLPEHGFVFCAFNGQYKITPAMFAVWMELLAAVADSVLWLIEGSAAARDNLRAAAAAHGIAPERLVFAPKLPLTEHLARHALADLFLDTLPCSAHTTASDALWAGLPVLTCAGDSFAGRVGASVVTAAGLSELAVGSLADYRELALSLARDRDRLRALRERLERNRLTCPLFDTLRFTRHLEALYGAMWERHLGGLPPRRIEAGDRPTVS